MILSVIRGVASVHAGRVATGCLAESRTRACALRTSKCAIHNGHKIYGQYFSIKHFDIQNYNNVKNEINFIIS